MERSDWPTLRSLGTPIPPISTKHFVHTPEGCVVGAWGLGKCVGKTHRDTRGEEKNNDRHKKSNKKRQNVHIARQSLRCYRSPS